MAELQISLSLLASEQGFSVQGDSAVDQAGRSVSSAGDINGDGIDDVIIGAWRGDNGGNDAGEAYVIFGKAGATRSNIDLTSLSAQDGFVIQGEMSSDYAGRSVAKAGDFNGDGIDDIIIGAYGHGLGFTGAAYVILGMQGATRANLDLSRLASTDGFKIEGASFEGVGLAVSGGFDCNGDGFDDLIIGAPFNDESAVYVGRAYVIYGRSTVLIADIDLSNLAHADGFILHGENAYDYAGESVSSAGDINGDGYDDIIIGAPSGENGSDTPGNAYVLFGKSGSIRTDIALSAIAADDGFVVQGELSNDQAGHSVSSAGDVNGDGYDDLIVGAPYNNDNGAQAGQAYVIFGKPGSTRSDIDLSSMSAEDGFRILGEVTNDYAGWSVAMAGDVNGDGYDDLILGAVQFGGTGKAYVLFGKAGANRSDIDLASLSAVEGVLILGGSAGDQAGRSVSSAGDVNGDGYDDIVIGAPLRDDDVNNAGKAYVLFGNPNFGLPPGHAPQLDHPIGDQFSSEDAPWSFQFPADAFTDADGDTLTFSASLADGGGLPAWLAFTVASRTFSGIPPLDFNGVLAIKVTASDGNQSTSDTFSLTITPLNDVPVAADITVTANEDASTAFNVSGSIQDADGDTLSVATGPAMHGTASIDAGFTITYSPEPDFNGTDEFTYTVSDGNGGSDTATVTVTVNPVNDLPIAHDDELTTLIDTPRTFAAFLLLSNDTDIDGDMLSITSVGGAENGTIALDSSTLTFNPASGFTGVASFTYTVSDGHGETDSARVTVTVNDANQPPLADATHAIATLANTLLVFDVKASDPDGDALSYVLGTPTNGNVSVVGDRVTYTPNPGFTGSDSFTVSIDDGNGGTAQQVVTVSVTELASASDFSMFLSDGFTGGAGGSGSVFGTIGFQDITIIDVPGTFALDPSFNRGGDILRLSGNAADWSVARLGSSALFSDGDTFVTVPVGSAGLPVVFDDGVRELKFDNLAGGFTIGGELFGFSTFIPIDAAPDGTMLPTGSDPGAKAVLFLAAGAGASAAGVVDIFGTTSAEPVSLISGTITLDPSFNRGGDTVAFDELATDFTATRTGSSIQLDGSDTQALVPVGSTGATLTFGDGSDMREVRFDGDAMGFVIGTQLIGFDPVQLMAV